MTPAPDLLTCSPATLSPFWSQAAAAVLLRWDPRAPGGCVAASHWPRPARPLPWLRGFLQAPSLSQPLPAPACRLDPAPSPPPGSHGNLAERGRCWLIHTAWGYCCLHLKRQSPGLNLILTGFHEPNRKLSRMVSFHVHCLLHMANDPPAEVTREKFTVLVSSLPSCFRTFSRLVSRVPS